MDARDARPLVLSLAVLALALLVIVAPLPVTAVKVPCSTLTVVCNTSVPPTLVSFRSDTVMALDVPVPKLSVASSSRVCAAGSVLMGASLTGLTVTAMLAVACS